MSEFSESIDRVLSGAREERLSFGESVDRFLLEGRSWSLGSSVKTPVLDRLLKSGNVKRVDVLKSIEQLWNAQTTSRSVPSVAQEFWYYWEDKFSRPRGAAVSDELYALIQAIADEA